MNILYTINDAFCGKVGAAICAVFENNRSVDDLHVFIIGQDISNTNKERFINLAQKYERRIDIIPIGDISGFFDFEFDTLGWNPVVMARLLLDHLLPDDIDRILYMDGDTIVRGSLSEIWNKDMGEKIIGGSIEATTNRKRLELLDMKGVPYINSGVLLIDLKKWREKDLGTSIIKYYKDNDGRLFAPDQDAINGAAKDYIYYLPPKYNFYNIYWFYPYRYLKKLMKGAAYYSRKVFDDSLKNPVIIHYLGEERPWRHGNSHPYKKDYVKYLSLSPWKDEPEEEGWETYFKVWGLFNFIMKPFPALRYHIIDGLIPLFMKWRKKQRTKKG